MLHIDREQGAAAIEQQYSRLAEGLGITATPPGLFVWPGAELDLNSPDGLAWLEEEVVRRSIGLVTLDSFQMCFPGVKENDATEVGLAFNGLIRLRNMHNVGFLIVHHSKKPPSDGRPALLELVRGSTTIVNQAGTVWFAMPRSVNAPLELARAKARVGEEARMQVRYSAEPFGGAITLTGEGTVEEAETAQARAEVFVAQFLEGRGRARWAELVKAGADAGHAEMAVRRARDQLVRLKTVQKLQRGLYGWGRLSAAAAPVGEELPL